MTKKEMKVDSVTESDRLKGLLHFVIQNCPRCSVSSEETMCPFMKAPCLFNPLILEENEI